MELRRKLEPAEIFHEVLEHRWYMSEAQQCDITTEQALEDYINNVLPQHRDEESFLSLGDTQEMAAIFGAEDEGENAPLTTMTSSPPGMRRWPWPMSAIPWASPPA